MTRDTGHIWRGLFLSPLPMVLFWLAVTALTSGISATAIAFVLLAYIMVWIPLLFSWGILRLASWHSRKAHLWVMFVVTFVPMLSVYRFFEFSPDASFSYEINDGGTQVIEFSLAGIAIAAMVALTNAACMLIYWQVAVRDRQ